MKLSKQFVKELIQEAMTPAKKKGKKELEKENDTRRSFEEGMFGLTTDSGCENKLREQRDMWLSRVSSLYIALRDTIGPQQADMALDSIQMSPADLRPEERSRLEEAEDKYVFDADALERWPNPADRKEMCNNKSQRGERVQWVVRKGKGRCEKA